MAIEMYASAAGKVENPWKPFMEVAIKDFRSIAWRGALHEASLYLDPKKTTEGEIRAWSHIVQTYVTDNQKDHNGFLLLAQFNAASGEREIASNHYKQAAIIAYNSEEVSPIKKSKAIMAAAKHFAIIKQPEIATKFCELALRLSPSSPETIKLVVDFYMDKDCGNNRARALEILQSSPKSSIRRKSMQDALTELSSAQASAPNTPAP